MLVPNTLSLEDIYITRRGYTIHHILVSVSVQIYTIYRGFAFRKPDPPFHEFVSMYFSIIVYMLSNEVGVAPMRSARRYSAT